MGAVYSMSKKCDAHGEGWGSEGGRAKRAAGGRSKAAEAKKPRARGALCNSTGRYLMYHMMSSFRGKGVARSGSCSTVTSNLGVLRR
jgi:hypothetical protein